MAQRFVHLDISVDVTSPEEMNALYSFLSKIGKEAKNGPEPEPVPQGASADPIPPQKTTKQKTKKEAAPKPAEPEPEPVPETPTEEAPMEETQAEPAKEYKIEEVREKLKEKVSEHREEIKAKLTELGAPNVSSLDPGKYADFVNFLESLS